MAIFVTGRERTVTLSGSSSGTAYDNNIYPNVAPEYRWTRRPSYALTALGVHFAAQTAYIFESYPNPTRARVGERVTIDLPAGLGSTSGEYSQWYYPPAAYSGSLSGTWQVSATLQECVEITESGVDGLDVRFFERLKPGTDISASISAGGASASISATVPSDAHIEVVANFVSPAATAELLYEPPTGSDTCQSTLSYSTPQSLTDPQFSQSQTSGNVQRAISVSATQAQATVTITAGNTVLQSCTASANLYAPKLASWQARVKAVDVDYPDPLQAQVLAKAGQWEMVNLSNGAGALSIEQKRYQILSVLEGTAPSVNEWATVQCSLVPASLQAVGDDENATRLFGHGWKYAIALINHATRRVLDTCDSLADSQRQWAAVQDCTLVAAAGIITVTPTGASPIVRRTLLQSPERWNSHAFLRLRLMATVDDAPFALVIGGKRWEARTGVPALTWTEVYIDLCAPQSESAPFDLQTSLYPIGRADGPYWGVTETTEQRLELANATWYIDELSLDVQPWASRTPPYNVPNHSLSIMPSFGWWQDRGDGWLAARLVTGQSDGKQALEGEHERKNASTGVVVARTLQQLLSDLSSEPGWFIAPTIFNLTGCNVPYPALSPCYLNDQRPATWLCGAGLLYDGTNWTPFGGRTNLSLNAQAQCLYDSIDWYAGIGDAWQFGSGAYGSPLVLAYGAVLRGRAFGIALQSNKQRLTTGVLELRRASDGQSGGSGDLAGWGGMYETGANYAKAPTDYRLESAGLPTTTRTYYTRMPLRTVVVAIPQIPLRVLEADSAPALLHVASPGLMKLFHAADGAELLEDSSWDQYEPIRLRIDPRWNAMWALWKDSSGNIYLQVAWDRISKSAGVIALTARTALVEAISPRGTLVLIWENSGNVKVRYSYDGGTTWTADQDALLGGSAFQAELIDSDYEPRWDAIYMVIRQSGVYQLLVSYDFGANWSVLVS